MINLKPSSEEPRIAVLSDTHGDIKAVKKVVDYLKKHPVDLLVLPGDIGFFTIRSYERIFRLCLKLKIPFIPFPGSHENSFTWKKAIKKVNNKLLIDGYKNNFIKFADYNLIIFPGSEAVSSGTIPYNGGNIWMIDKKLNPSDKRKRSRRLRELKYAKKSEEVSIFEIEKELKKKKISGKKTIMFSHDPLRCKTKKGIDNAHFGVVTKEFNLRKRDGRLKVFKDLKEDKGNFHLGGILALEAAKVFRKYKYPIKLMKKNVGSVALRKIANKYKITKSVSGHIHEAGKRAINKKENKVKQNTFSKEMFLNSGPNILTILTLNKKGEVKHKFYQI